jgi:iron-sulfur cluster repair protein YtfE (RIC family)
MYSSYLTDTLMRNLTGLDTTMTINEIVARFAETMPVFNRFGLDTCCGGGVTVEEAARRDDIDVDVVLAALHEAIDAS